jgi:hypothetical protein
MTRGRLTLSFRVVAGWVNCRSLGYAPREAKIVVISIVG